MSDKTGQLKERIRNLKKALDCVKGTADRQKGKIDIAVQIISALMAHCEDCYLPPEYKDKCRNGNSCEASVLEYITEKAKAMREVE